MSQPTRPRGREPAIVASLRDTRITAGGIARRGIKHRNCEQAASRVSRWEKTLRRVLVGMAEAAIDFESLRALLQHLGFTERQRGSHHIFTRSDIAEIVNLQPRGGRAKPYQVRQVRNLIVRSGLGGSQDGG